jgi:hypothetical protein
MGLHTAEGFQRTGTRRISSWPGEINLHKQAGYIDADFLHRNTFPLQSDGGPYISETSKQIHYQWFNQMWTRTAGFAIEWEDQSSNGSFFRDFRMRFSHCFVGAAGNFF